MKPQWQKRLELTIVIYQYLLMELERQKAIEIAFIDFSLDSEEISILEHLIDNINEYVKKIKPYLDPTWTWERMSFFDRAILLEALAENDIKHTPKAIIIDQALITARKYNIDDKSYKYINAILEKVL